jgi:hypothetical protein
VRRFGTPPSLPLVSGLIREERLAQAAHAEALDTKAGVILGFSGALVALASGHSNSFAWLGRWTAAAAAALALWAFVPRRLPVPDPLAARDLLELDQDVAAFRLMDAEIGMIGQGRVLVGRKSLRIKLSLALLVVAIGLTAFAGVVK